MGRYAVLDGSTVANIITAETDFAANIGAIPAEHGGTTAQIGGGWDGSVFTPPPGPSGPTDEEWNAAIIAQINSLDLRRIRPLAEGDADFLDALNAQIADLRAQLRK